MPNPIGTGADANGHFSEGSDAILRAQEATKRSTAAENSAHLLECCNMLYRRFARRHGLDFETARRLQLGGYRA